MKQRRFHPHRKIREAVGILTGVITFMGIVCGLNYLYVETTEREMIWSRVLWHNYYEDRGKIDNIYLGSSHVYNDIDPRILDKLSEQCNFNLSTASQTMNGSFYLLKEAGQDNELSNVYLEMYYQCSVNDTKMDNEYHRNWNNIDYMELSLNKIQYMISNGGLDRCLDNFFPFVRYRTKLGDWEYVKQVMEDKREMDYLAYQYRSDYEDGNGYIEFMKQGFRNYTRMYPESKMRFNQTTILEKHSMGQKSEQYCRKVIEYCQKEDIPITLFVSPICDLQLISTEGYDNYIDEIRKIAGEYEIPFYDFNLAKEQYLPLQANEHFGDIGHLNSYGAAVFTSFFYEVVSGEEEENEKYFYASYADKLQGNAPALYGIYYRNSEESEQTRIVWIASNRDSEMEYKVVLTPNEGEPYIVQDFDTNKEFAISKEEHGICSITARMQGASEEIRTMEIDY